MKTFAIFPVADMTIEGKAFTPADQVGVVSVDESVSMMTLLGMIQFGRCNAVELDPAEIMAESEGFSEAEADSMMLDGGDLEDVPTLDDQPEEVKKDAEQVEQQSEQAQEVVQKQDAPTTTTSSNPFLADGLDENIAEILHGQSLTPDAIRSMIAEGFDLTDLTGIGKTRAAQITAIYGK
jgi:hypothetical protein